MCSSSCGCYDKPIFDTAFDAFFQTKVLIYVKVFLQ